MLYSLSLMALKNDAAEEQTAVRVHPGVFLSRILSRMIDEYQSWAPMSALDQAS